MRTKLYNCSVRYSHIRKTVSHTYISRKQTHFTWPKWFRYEWYGVVDSQWNFFSLFIFIYPFSRFFFSSNLVKCWYFNETSWSASECNDTNTILSNTYWIGVHISGEKMKWRACDADTCVLLFRYNGMLLLMVPFDLVRFGSDVLVSFNFLFRLEVVSTLNGHHHIGLRANARTLTYSQLSQLTGGHTLRVSSTSRKESENIFQIDYTHFNIDTRAS